MTELKAIATKLKGNNNPRLKFKAVPWTSEDGKAFKGDNHIALTHWSKGGKDVDVSQVEKQVGVWQYCSEVSGEALHKFMQKYDYFDSPEIGRATSELQSLMRISYAVFCLQKKKIATNRTTTH